MPLYCLQSKIKTKPPLSPLPPPAFFQTVVIGLWTKSNVLDLGSTKDFHKQNTSVSGKKTKSIDCLHENYLMTCIFKNSWDPHTSQGGIGKETVLHFRWIHPQSFMKSFPVARKKSRPPNPACSEKCQLELMTTVLSMWLPCWWRISSFGLQCYKMLWQTNKTQLLHSSPSCRLLSNPSSL